MTFKKREVIKHSSAIQISNRVSLLQRRAWNILLANAFDNLVINDAHIITVKELCDALKYNSNDLKYIKTILKGLVTTSVEFNVLNKDGKLEWGIRALLSEVTIVDGVIQYSYAKSLATNLHNPKMYARLSLSLQNEFKSKHSLALYEIFLDYFDMERNFGETPWLSIDKFRDLVGLSDNEYKRYTDLNHYIIKKSLTEINKLTQLEITQPKPKKKGRTISEIKFFIRKKGDIEAEYEVIDPDGDDLLSVLVNKFDVELTKAKKLIKEYDEAQILKNLDYVNNYKGKPVGNLAGLTVQAIQNNWQSIKKNNSDIHVENETNDNIIITYQDIEEIVNKERIDKLEKIKKEISKDELLLLENSFIKSISAGEYGPFVKKNFLAKGFDGVGIGIQFKAYLSDRFLNPLKHDINDYIKNNNIELYETV